MYVKMVTRPMYKKKEVSTPPNKMKHISPLQRHVFFPLTCRILKINHIFSTISLPFCHDWQRVQEVRKLHPWNIKMIKDDQGGTKNPYKCMNVMKQDAMDEKIQERCKTFEKQCMQENLDRSKVSRGIKQTLMNRTAIKKLSRRQELSRSIHLAIKRYRECDKNKLKILTDRLGIERYQGAI